MFGTILLSSHLLQVDDLCQLPFSSFKSIFSVFVSSNNIHPPDVFLFVSVVPLVTLKANNTTESEMVKEIVTEQSKDIGQNGSMTVNIPNSSGATEKKEIICFNCQYVPIIVYLILFNFTLHLHFLLFPCQIM